MHFNCDGHRNSKEKGLTAMIIDYFFYFLSK